MPNIEDWVIMRILSFFVVAAVVAVMCSCDNGAAARWQSEKDSIMNVNRQQRQVLDDLTTSLVEVSASLDSIAVGEGMLQGTDEAPVLTRKQMLDNLATFKATLAENKAKLAELEKKLAGRDNELAKLGKVVSYLKGELEAKEARIAELEEELSNANANIQTMKAEIGSMSNTIGSLKVENEEKNEVIQSQDAALHTGYYAIGKKKDLKNSGLLKRRDLKYENFDQSLFTKVDIRNFTEMTIPSKKAKILTSVPEGSYVITREGKSSCTLKITDVNSFWSVSRYLVIQID